MATIFNSKHHYIIILCGGTGPRLWPLSRASNPKQFLELFSSQSLLEQTLARAQKIVPKNNIFIVTNQRYQQQISKLLANQLPQSNIISEPDKRNTLQAISYAVATIRHLDPKAVISSIPSDHFIYHTPIFRQQLKQSASIAASLNSFVLIGIKATSANPSYGYFQISPKPGKTFSKVSQFIEKPSVPQATKLLAKKALWNSGMYTFSIDTFLLELQKLQPEYFALHQKIYDNISHPNIISKLYKLAPNLPIDTAISQKSNNLVALVAKFVWSDIGEWKSIHQHLKADKDKNTILGQSTKFLSVSSSNCLVSGQNDKLIGLVGVKDLAIIDTPDGLLICNLNDSFNVRDLVSLIVKSKNTQKYFLD